MATQILDQSTLEEKLVWYGIVLTYPFYMIGGLYITGSLLGWLILGLAYLRFMVEGSDAKAKVPILIWLWIAGMLMMEVALLLAHINWDLTVAQTIKSTIGWAKGWALLALFPLLGAIVNVRPEILCRAICVVSVQSIFFAAFTFLAYLISIPGEVFVSPLRVVGGPGDEFFSFKLYGINPETGSGRWQFFCPWAPAAGLIACVYAIFCLMEKDIFWQRMGLVGCFVTILFCQSRAGMVVFPVVIFIYLFADRIFKPRTLIILGIALPLIFILGEVIYDAIMSWYQSVKDARPDSSRVRSTLARLALQRWASEAPIFGHGIVERGPKIVELMPIGSHHTWYGLLFVKGIVGFLALLIPLACTLLYLIIAAQSSKIATGALAMIGVLAFYSFFENLEILSYLYWPALFWLGIALNPLKTGDKS
jgi:hypothetical protein